MRGFCRECHERVLFARTESLKWQALNPQPDPAGNVHAYEVSPGNWLARSVKPGTPAVAPDVLMMPHQATCTGKRAEPPAEPELPKGVTSLAAWRRDRRLKAGVR